MNQLETKVVEFCAAAKQLAAFRLFRPALSSPMDIVRSVQQEDKLRERMDELEAEIDSEFDFATKTAQDWGQISGIPDMVLDVVIRSSEANAAVSMGVSIRNQPNPLLTAGTLLKLAANASNRRSTGAIAERDALRSCLQAVYLALGDLVSEAWRRRK